MNSTYGRWLAHGTLVLALGVLLSACSSSNSPTNPTPPDPAGKRLASVSGTVTGAASIDVNGITIGLSSTGSPRTVVTSSDGSWRIDSVPAGAYTVAPTKAGLNFVPSETDITVDTASITGIAFLAREAISTGNRPDLVEIPAGEFVMGTGYPYELAGTPKLRVRFTRGWYAAITETTQEQFQRVMGYNPSAAVVVGGPVNGLALLEMMQYCNKLSELEGLTPCYALTDVSYVWNNEANGYRLPTDAEWEYMARAGDTTVAYGRSEHYTQDDGPERVISIIGDIAWFLWNSADPPDYSNPKGPFQVALKRPNAWGLYDVLGNVVECVYDQRVQDRKELSVDPVGIPGRTENRMPVRGGHFKLTTLGLPWSGNADVRVKQAVWGFRVVRSMF
jgi:formylglycine-generating enzyme required for sulfatase activity